MTDNNAIISLLRQLISTPSFSREEDDTAVILEDFLQKKRRENFPPEQQRVGAKPTFRPGQTDRAAQLAPRHGEAQQGLHPRSVRSGYG